MEEMLARYRKHFGEFPGVRPCGKLPFDFTAKFCIIDVLYFEV